MPQQMLNLFGKLRSRSFLPVLSVIKMAASNVDSPALIEVERRFIINDDIEKKLKELGAKLKVEKSFTDSYYDNDAYMLTSHDHWLRRRGNKWELKHPPENCVSHSELGVQYVELETEPQIIAKIKTILAKIQAEDSDSLEDILTKSQCDVFAKYTTWRKSYQLDEFSIDLDITDFGFSVGEIEKMVTKQAEVAQAFSEIDGIAQKLGVKSCGPIGGKMSMFLSRFRPVNYQHLLKLAIISPAQDGNS